MKQTVPVHKDANDPHGQNATISAALGQALGLVVAWPSGDADLRIRTVRRQGRLQTVRRPGLHTTPPRLGQAAGQMPGLQAPGPEDHLQL